MKIATIARDKAHSPNMAANDTAILEAVSEELRNRGAEVFAAEGDSFEGFDAVCHMSRTHTVLNKLGKAEEEGIIIINSPKAIENCSRQMIMETLDGSGIPQPAFTMIENSTEIGTLHYPAWIKRAEGCSCHRNDVCYAGNADEARAAIQEMRSRGIDKQIHCEHIEGDIIKFYGVGRNFFRYCYPDPEKSKFGLERINGCPKHYPFSPDEMKKIVFTAAQAAGLEIYGGDCIVDHLGRIYIIDLNDFPSFSPVRDEAAKEIAEHIINKIKGTK